MFRKFPTFFVTDIDRKRNREMLNMTLREIFEKKELYTHEKGNGFENYLHNYKTVQNEEIKKNEELKNILLKTFSELFEEYINSDEFNVEEINRLSLSIPFGLSVSLSSKRCLHIGIQPRLNNTMEDDLDVTDDIDSSQLLIDFRINIGFWIYNKSRK